MRITLTPRAQEEFLFWQRSEQKNVLKKISELLDAIAESPFEGIGKPEQLKHNLAGKWSRRISGEHRLVYRLEEDKIFILSLRGHY